MRNPGPDVLSLTEKVNILLAISHKGSAAKQHHKEPTPRTASWTFSPGEDGCVWFNFSWVSRQNASLLPHVTPCILPDTPFLSIFPAVLCKSVLSSPSMWPFRVSCYFPCFWLSFTHVKIKGQIICWLGTDEVSLTPAELLNLKAAEGLQMGKNKHPTSRHTPISALQPLLYHLFWV